MNIIPDETLNRKKVEEKHWWSWLQWEEDMAWLEIRLAHT
jgi:hypothetical protein